MRIVVAVGGNALPRRSDPMTIEVQRRNVRIAAAALAPLAAEHSVIVVPARYPPAAGLFEYLARDSATAGSTAPPPG